MAKKLKFVKYLNGNFPLCPRCGKTMARNACGYYDCIFGCGYSTYKKKKINSPYSLTGKALTS